MHFYDMIMIWLCKLHKNEDALQKNLMRESVSGPMFIFHVNSAECIHLLQNSKLVSNTATNPCARQS